ncbi:MAG: hypothetical protein FJW95_04715 [Actinobacteria bacterium]|nr:hypothetical protein [Actinomycetota bacterium]
MHRTGRGARACVALVVLVTGALLVGAPSAGAGQKPRPKRAAALWRVGTCYAVADVATQTIDLTSAVACAEDHTVQVVAGAPLPKPLAKTDRATLLDPTSKPHAALVAFAEARCRPRATVKHLYPESADVLRELFETYEITRWMPPAAGQLGWLVPDADSFALGATDVVCVHVTDPEITGSTAGDLRRISTRAPLATMRLCANLGGDGGRAAFATCDRPHDIQTLLRVTLDVRDKPDDVLQWTDDDWRSIDVACQDLATAVIGAKRNSILINADTDPDQPAVDGTRLVDCRAVPFDEAKAFAAGTVVTGAGQRPIRMTRA